jgi:hypothetical protein
MASKLRPREGIDSGPVAAAPHQSDGRAFGEARRDGCRKTPWGERGASAGRTSAST